MACMIHPRAKGETAFVQSCFFSSESSNSRISFSSAFEAFLVLSACMTNWHQPSPRMRGPTIAHQLPLRDLGRHDRFVDMRSLPIVAAHEPFVGHDLQQLQRRGVAGAAIRLQGFLHGANGAWSAIPQNAKDCQFGVRGPGEMFFAHADQFKKMLISI